MPVFCHAVSSIVNEPHRIALTVLATAVQRAVERRHRRSACAGQAQAARERRAKMSSHERLACLHARPIRNKAQPTADWARGMLVACLPVFLTSFKRLYQ